MYNGSKVPEVSNAQRQKDIRDRLNRNRARAAERTSGRGVRPPPAQRNDLILGTGDEHEASQVDGSGPESVVSGFGRVLRSTVRQLKRGDEDNAADYVVREILPWLTSLQHGANFALYSYLSAIYHVASLLRQMRRDEKRVLAVKRALKLGSGSTIYLQLLNGLAPPPAGDESGARRAVQNRYSTYNCALKAAERQGLDARRLLTRLMRDKGIEKLVEEDRASKAESSNGAVEDTPPFVTRSERRRESRRDHRDPAERKERPRSEKDAGATTTNRSVDKDSSDSSSLDPVEAADEGYQEMSAALLVSQEARDLIRSGSGKRLFIADIRLGRIARFKVQAVQPLPDRLRQSDDETLRMMIRKVV